MRHSPAHSAQDVTRPAAHWERTRVVCRMYDAGIQAFLKPINFFQDYYKNDSNPHIDPQKIDRV